eukprot:g12892.t1
MSRTLHAISLYLPCKPTLEDTIEHVFTVLRDQSELENGIPVPPKFFYFYDSEMLRHFLACVVYYFYAFTQVKDLESDLINSPSDERAKLQLHESRKALQQRLRIFAEAYSRLLLHCSNFEHTQEDQSFFEFLFEFTRTTFKMILKRYARKKNDDFFKVANRLQSNTAEAEKAINLAKKLLASHKHKVTRVPRAKSVRGKHNKIVKMTKLSQLNEKRLGLSANLPTERARDFSIH